MFDSEFFPTHSLVIDQMINGIDLNGKIILEPSAGKGDIVDYVLNYGASVLICEKDLRLAAIVKDKGNFLCHDFFDLKQEQISHIDMIVMNPPFSNADKHILRAWEIAPEGCHIIALCNFETVKNDRFRNRKELNTLIELYGSSENIGPVFDSAERKTNVEIGLVNLFKPKTGDFEFDGYFSLEDNQDEQHEQGLIPYNEIRNIVNRYVGAVKMFDEVMNASTKINELASVFTHYNQIKFGAFKADERSLINVDRDTYKKELQKSAWHSTFAKLNMDKYVTQSLKNDINKFVERQQHVPFTMENVFKMLEIINGTHKGRMLKAIEDVFDRVTMHYHDNRYQVEGWKTNDSYIINKKLIIPSIVSLNYSKELSIRHDGHNVNLLEDLCKALCFLSGTNYNSCQTLYSFQFGIKRIEEWYFTNENLIKQYSRQYKEISLKAQLQISEAEYVNKQIASDFNCHNYKEPIVFGQWYDWNFFRIKCFKKGTLHMEFKDDQLWELFNRTVADIKGFVLPEKI